MYRVRALAARIVDDMRKQSLLLILGIAAEILCASTVAAGDGGNRQSRDNGAWHCAVIDGGEPPPTRQRSPLRATPIQPASTGESSARSGATYDPADRAAWSLQLGAVRPPHAHRAYFGPAAGIPIAGDFNGDGYDELGMYLDGRWYVDLNGNGTLDSADLVAQLGAVGDRPIVGDWNQDGKADIGIFTADGPATYDAARLEPGLPHPLNDRTDVLKNFGVREPGLRDAFVRTEALGSVRRRISHVFQFGSTDDVPVVGDWQGSGVRSIGVFHDGEWTLDLDGDGKLTEADGRVRLGEPGDLPVVGDFDRDGLDELGVYRRGLWILDTTGDRRLGDGDLRLQLGGDGDTPVVGDWDGDGRDQIGVVHRGSAS